MDKRHERSIPAICAKHWRKLRESGGYMARKWRAKLLPMAGIGSMIASNDKAPRCAAPVGVTRVTKVLPIARPSGQAKRETIPEPSPKRPFERSALCCSDYSIRLSPVSIPFNYTSYAVGFWGGEATPKKIILEGRSPSNLPRGRRPRKSCQFVWLGMRWPCLPIPPTAQAI